MKLIEKTYLKKENPVSSNFIESLVKLLFNE
jgi:hypothetical protein